MSLRTIVRLPIITTDSLTNVAATDKIADFKPLFDSMLEVTSYEQSVLRTTRALLIDDAAHDFEALERTRRMAMPLSGKDSKAEMSGDEPVSGTEGSAEQRLVQSVAEQLVDARLRPLASSPAPLLHLLLRHVEADEPLDAPDDAGQRRGRHHFFYLQ